jgi:acylphosphatase
MKGRRVHLLVRGLVQGVSFRATAQAEARRLHLGGWVRNLPSGEVEVEAEGAPEAVEAFLAWCRRGPRGARVDEVDVEEAPAGGELRGFQVTYS